ncbi:DUF4123 domain-containing protein [Cupriavidus gilardii]|uniref:DUF4123 domain-containing protein n=1 Tax=Cupriavidus gilardii TaxID=82541 RepID=UPI0015738A37|nr:DUF4123 domain-containing protein [Cupriavidus gilardii]NSX06298.1 DUF4123 domain-containing protein [Cupriavidus gilardii]
MPHYAIIDSAQQPDYYRRLDRYGVTYRSLFDGHAEAGMKDIAPLLLDVETLPDGQCDRIRADIRRLGSTRPCISLLKSARSLDDLAAHFSAYHVVDLPGQERMILRWYDTRILPTWWNVMTLAQCRAFGYGIDEWRYFDRYGAECRLPSITSPTDSVGLEFAPLRLTQSQYDDLLAAAEADVAIANVRNVIPDELRRVPMHTLYPFVDMQLAAARAHGLDDLDEQVQFLLLALYTSGRFAQHPIAQQRLKKPASEHAQSFADWTAGVPDAVWESGRPLWECVSTAT